MDFYACMDCSFSCMRRYVLATKVCIKMKGRKIMNKKSAFTLAEVLITLGIIGVVAAMTIPTLMNKTSEAQFRTGYKKILSTLSQAVNMSMAMDNTDFSDFDATGTGSTDNSIYNMFNTRMSVLKTAMDDAGIKAANTNYTLFFNDGMAVSFPTGSVGCRAAAPCKALVDVNGIKKPNTLTASSDSIKDQFGVKFQDQQVVPTGIGAYVLYSANSNK